MPTFNIDVSIKETGRKAPSYNIESDLDGEITLAELLDFTKQALVVTARETLNEELARGFDKGYLTLVDGRKGKPLEAVNPLGKIEFFARRSFAELARETYEGILGRSPVDTARYIHSNFVFLNGYQVATDYGSLAAWLDSNPQVKDNDLLQFINIEPYARKLERMGVTFQRTKSRLRSRDKRRSGSPKVLAPNGTYFLTARAIARKYKNNSAIKFGFTSGSQLVGVSGSFKSKGKGTGRAYLYPTISIVISQVGIL